VQNAPAAPDRQLPGAHAVALHEPAHRKIERCAAPAQLAEGAPGARLGLRADA
jgi:hypothetical protein